MILNTISRHSKFVAYCFLLLFISDFAWAGRVSVINRDKSWMMYGGGNPRYSGELISGVDKRVRADHGKETAAPATVKKEALKIGIANKGVKQGFIGGPSQPEMAAFQSVNANNIVDLFSGDFSYNIPLMDVGGYPIGLSYRGGITMDQEASWVGLGWNVNPGTITRNLRGLPDDFNGKCDSIKKVTSIRDNKTIGVTAGGDVEIVGAPISVGASLGVFHNNYKGWGIENSVNASINSGTGAKGPLSGGLSITNNSQEGLTIAPSLSVKFGQYDADEKGAYGTFTTSLPYNSRSGLKAMQLSVGVTQFKKDLENQRNSRSSSNSFSTSISFASPTFVPSITMPFTSTQFSFTGKIGAEINAFHPNFYISGYVAKQGIKPEDTLLALPSFGYLYYQEGAKNRSSLLDFNREKEIPYREKPAMPHIAVPMYTYDAFSITGEGTGGMFRAYRGDIGFIHDHFIRTKDNSNRVSIDLGTGNLVHGGIDLNINRAFTQNGPWLGDNTLKNIIDFRSNKDSFEAVYFRNPGEKAINSKAFYNAVGGDDVVTVGLFQAGNSSSSIQATNYLMKYHNKRLVGQIPLTSQNSIKPERDKRMQVISYLNAKEADAGGLSKYIENYTINQFTPYNCSVTNWENLDGTGTGLPAEYYKQLNFKGVPDIRQDGVINFDWGKGAPYTGFPSDRFSIRRVGRLKAPLTGTYNLKTDSDDGIRVWLNDSLIINQWDDHGHMINTSIVNLVANEFYTIRMEYYENKGKAVTRLLWSVPNNASVVPIPQQYLYAPAKTEYVVSPNLTKEKRINSFRRETHMSEIDVLNTDGKRYVYGLPVYNLKQKEATFSVQNTRGNSQTGLVGYNNGIDNTANNHNGKDWYYNSETTPAYAHSFLLTGILSEDYIDVTGNGISNDDLGDAVKFNYSKTNGIANPYRWRAPYIPDSATYNESLRTETRDDKGSYVYGEKELWYLHSIESKTMIATFTVENRLDQLAIDEAGHKYNDNGPKRLKEINLYSKADFIQHGTNATAIKTVHFEYSYELCPGVSKPFSDSGKLTLKKVWFSYNGNNKGKLNPYIFNYNSKNPSYNLKSSDRWGSYKDPLQNPGSTPTNLITNAEYPYALQDSVAAAVNAGAWSLDSIYLPSGGSLKIVYEGDDYGYVENRSAMQLFKLKGLANAANVGTFTNQLYTSGGDNLYAYIAVPQSVSSKADVYQKYLKGIQKLYFKLYVKMPSDQFGSGNEYVSCYADLEGDNYGLYDANTIWVKVSGISLKGDESGTYSPLAKAAIQFLRLNLPSKAYPGSETADNLDLGDAVKMIFTLADNIKNAFSSFDRIARKDENKWGSIIDTSRTFIRLNNPYVKKYGGGHRVKKVIIYDKWDKMTGQRAAMYGREYTYTTQKMINGVNQRISSGVASYEPGIGSEENPFRQPIEYVEKIAPLGPVTLGYSEEPLGEAMFPSASVGYGKVQVRTINYKNVKSANGFTETSFYTSYDFPVYTDRTMLDNDTKKRYKPALANFLRINAKHYITLSQGFKIELNDMNGKQRSEGVYAETDPNTPITYSENIYKVVDPKMEFKQLANTVSVISPKGLIDTTAVVGKDVELMMDMREQVSITNGNNVNLNADMFSIPFLPPFLIIPSFLNLAQREENQFRSVATLKVIQRYGILDSIIHIDKGSKVSTKDLLYDSETGDVVLTMTQNEFNDPVYTFNYPSYWAYEGMGPAYKNIDIGFQHVQIREGKILSGLPGPDSLFLSTGDEIMVFGKQAVGSQLPDCSVPFATFPLSARVWAIDSSILKGGAKYFFIVNRDGTPYTGFDVNIKIVRSGRRNLNSSAGIVTTMVNPIVKNGSTQQYELVLNTNSKVINAKASEFRQTWVTGNPICSTKVKTCPAGWNLNPNNPNYCIRDTMQPATIIDTVDICLANYQDVNYSACGSFIYNLAQTSCSAITNNNLWVNVQGFTQGACDPTSSCILMGGGGGQSRMATPQESPLRNPKKKILFNAPAEIIPIAPDSTTSSQPMKTTLGQAIIPRSNLTLAVGQPEFQTEAAFFFQPQVFPTGNDSLIGPLNRSGIWPCQPPGTQSYMPQGSYRGYTDTLYIPESRIYYIGMGADNRIKVYIDGVLFKHLDDAETLRNFERWHIFPDSITAGIHTIRIEGYNEIKANFNPALFGVEVYNNTEQELRNARCYYGCSNPLNMIFSTRDAVGKQFYVYGNCPAGFTLNGSTCTRRDSVPSSLSSTSVTGNNYVDGRLGSWREFKSYVYYTMRKETNPLIATNIRTDGTFSDYNSFWSFLNSKLLPQYDTARWVWNSEMTLFNRRGSEIENKDALGLYNIGIYGYDQNLPIATVRNSHINESAYDGFEDYGFQTFSCDTCSPLRHFDIGINKNKIVSTQKHTGKYSLKIDGNQSVSLQYKVLAPSVVPLTDLKFNTTTNSCYGGLAGLQSVTSDTTAKLIGFFPYQGKKMIVSAWVKEEQDCSCASYVNNTIGISFTGSSVTYAFKPSGNIVEGWQRYESVFDIPATATQLSISLQSNSVSPAYFDDIRIHPFSSNMKSYVYNAVDLRLMAELDENNYAAFYEYNDDGTLIRVKKETQRGIKSITETRSALVKQ
jgi:hypothetical protein